MSDKEKKSIIYKKTKNRCAYCGIKLFIDIDHNDKKYMNIDHIFPRKHGGKNNLENLFACCKSCNSKKNHKTIEEYRQFITSPKFNSNQIDWIKKEFNIELDEYIKEKSKNHIFYFETIGVKIGTSF